MAEISEQSKLDHKVMERKLAKTETRARDEYWIHYRVVCQVEKVQILKLYMEGLTRPTDGARKKKITRPYVITAPKKDVPITINKEVLRSSGLRLIGHVPDNDYQIMLKIYCLENDEFKQHWFAIRWDDDTKDWRAKFVPKASEREHKIDRKKLFYIRINLPNEKENYVGTTNTYHHNSVVAITISDWIDDKHVETHSGNNSKKEIE